MTRADLLPEIIDLGYSIYASQDEMAYYPLLSELMIEGYSTFFDSWSTGRYYSFSSDIMDWFARKGIKHQVEFYYPEDAMVISIDGHPRYSLIQARLRLSHEVDAMAFHFTWGERLHRFYDDRLHAFGSLFKSK